MDERVARIREEEKKYHEACYDDYKLFEEGSWLHKPVLTVMNNLDLLDQSGPLSVLDLGCGVGRNSIPIAKVLQELHIQGQVVCVDLLESALLKLMSYGEQFGVHHLLKPVASDIGNFTISEKEYDYIVAVSSLEHVNTEAMLRHTLHRMTAGTKDNGINCIIINTNIRETDIRSGKSLEVLIEVNMETQSMEHLLSKAYTSWEVIDHHVKQLEFAIVRNERDILLSSDCITFVVRKIG
ncbi:class I SAM-dependent methyltransferase [Paenibacillus sp. MCAF9]|uniref:class I SAM-dependent methyltransferase n=1 Tax=Paenibacillus sp. MCAF9 TaxID=3233046 RepID=UPI003F946770